MYLQASIYEVLLRLSSYFDWKPYNHFLSSYLGGSRTTISYQAIKLGAVQPFPDVIPLRVIKNQAILVGSRKTV
jgi:hypothetical protein